MTQTKTIGFAGLGAMGGGMARRLLTLARPLHVFDPNPDALAALVQAGARPAMSIPELARQCDVVHTSLPSPEVFVQVYEEEILPNARPGQVYIDHTTAQVSDVRRLAEALAHRGGTLLDAPVSGGPGGASTGTLRVFVGGGADAFARLHDHFDAIGSNVTHCGPSGAGQIVKIVNQLGMGLSNAILLEALALGVRGGVDVDAIAKAVGSQTDGGEPWRQQLHRLASQVASDKVQWVSVKQAQLDDFLHDAQLLGQLLPATAAVARACRGHDRVVREANRMAASYWRILTAEAPEPLQTT